MLPTIRLTSAGFQVLTHDPIQKCDVARPLESHEFLTLEDAYMTIQPDVTLVDFFRAVLKLNYYVVQSIGNAAGCDIFAFANEAIAASDRTYFGTLTYRPKTMMLRNDPGPFPEHDLLLNFRDELTCVAEYPCNRIAQCPIRIESSLGEKGGSLLGPAVRLREFVLGVLWDLSFLGATPAERDATIDVEVPGPGEFVPAVEIQEEAPFTTMSPVKWIMAWV